LGVIVEKHGLILLDGRKVVFKNIGIGVVWVLEVFAVGTDVGRTEVAGGVVGGACGEVVVLLFTLPGPLCPVG
jgi:hypothetical protein